MDKKLISPKVHLVSGKGGVGKSIVARALADYFVRHGHKTLLVILSEEDQGDLCEPMASIRLVNDRLYFLKIFPDQALIEYLHLKIHQPKIVNKLLSQGLFRALCSAMPGLSDLTRLGKIWFHADEAHGHGEMFDKIVVDAPSSGFLLRFLSVARVVYEAVKIGPLAQEAKLMQVYFSNPEHAIVHLVCNPVDLVVKETIELYRCLVKAQEMALGLLFVNRCLAFTRVELDFFFAQLSSKLYATRKIISFFHARSLEEQSQQQALIKAGVMMPQINIADQFGEVIESKLIDDLIEVLNQEFSL